MKFMLIKLMPQSGSATAWFLNDIRLWSPIQASFSPFKPGCAWHRLWRYRHQPIVCVQSGRAGGCGWLLTRVLGALSLVVWSLRLIISLKYALLILRADNQGEGGIVAMPALLDARSGPSASWRGSILVLGMFGAAMLYGDGAITPAISVLRVLSV